MRMLKLVVPMVVLGLLALTAHTRAAEETKSDKGKITGTVVDKDGKAVASAKIKLMSKGEAKTDGDKSVEKPEAKANRADKAARKLAKEDGAKPKMTTVAETTADSDGKFTLDNVAPGHYTVGANMKGVGMARKEIDVKAGDTATVELKIEPKPEK